jgi:septum formation protein
MIKLSKPLILGSASPRRKEIIQNAGFDFEVITKPTDEFFPIDLNPSLVPTFLAEQKLAEFGDEFQDKIVLCADTVVILNNDILNKPNDEKEAKEMLQKLSGNKHEVITGVAFKHKNDLTQFSDSCIVEFNALSETEIDYYIGIYKPMDKAGAYGIQDFIGMIGVKSLNGSFYTVMGLPIHQVYEHLKKFITHPKQ